MLEFKIKHDETLNKTIRMKKSLIDEITALAGKHDISFNALVVQCCEFALQNIPEIDKVKNKVK
jgi:predicted HicB family RNase H-like nuclease